MSDIRKYVELLESAESIVQSSYIDDMVTSIHPREEDFDEGDLLHRIDRFDTYKLQNIPISKMNLDEFDIDEEYVEEIVDSIKEGNSLKPIVYDPIDGSIIDGNHRANAYSQLGYDSIQGYVGYEKNPDWTQDDEDYEDYEDYEDDED